MQLNQIGYRPNDKKKAIVSVSIKSINEFQVINMQNNAVVYRGKASASVYSEAAGETVCITDFSDVKEHGEYKLVSGEMSSFTFKICEEPYKELRKALLDFFHYQKCGIDLDAGKWSHKACHTSLGFIIDQSGKKTGETKDVSGGWHDAGDYGRYVVPAAQTVAQLLLANPDKTALEVIWFELEWLLKMQDSAGGVYHKVSCKDFNPLNEMPDKERDELLICPVSVEATADFAAVAALASRFFPEHKEKLLSASERAWEWCMKNSDVKPFENPPNITTGPYGKIAGADKGSKLFWAACELFGATGGKKYNEYIKASEITVGLGWRPMGTYGIIAYLKSADNDKKLAFKMKQKLITEAQSIIKKCRKDPYGISLGTLYRWGSNGDLGNNAMTLLLAADYDVGNEALYKEYALEHVHYLLGKNAVNYCYVSGFGSNPMRNPHHRPSVAVDAAVPGMVSGGAHGNTVTEQILHEHCAGLSPMKCYIDHIESFSANEITIYWNSPFYFILSRLEEKGE